MLQSVGSEPDTVLEDQVYPTILQTIVEHIVLKVLNIVSIKMTLIAAECLSRLWPKSEIDLFKLSVQWFHFIIDCFPIYFEISTLSSLSSRHSVEKCKSKVSRLESLK